MHNKILEAILKGVLMGLEIQDNELDLPIFQGSLITSNYHTDRADQIKWVRENFVDLGLPSGTKWCKYNLGATCGDTAESWKGDYYAWGETETKKTFELFNYAKYGSEDSRITLDAEDDVATLTLGVCCHLPSYEQIKELCSLPSEWVENYNGINCLNGRIFTGNNGHKLFIPTNGHYSGDYRYGGLQSCCLWSNERLQSDNENAYALFISIATVTYANAYSCHWGFGVRAVI